MKHITPCPQDVVLVESYAIMSIAQLLASGNQELDTKMLMTIWTYKREVNVETKGETRLVYIEFPALRMKVGGIFLSNRLNAVIVSTIAGDQVFSHYTFDPDLSLRVFDRPAFWKDVARNMPE